MAAFLLTVLATPFSCLPQAVGLAVYASHEEQVDVMLAAIADGRRERVAVSAAWAKGPVGQRLEEYEDCGDRPIESRALWCGAPRGKEGGPRWRAGSE